MATTEKSPIRDETYFGNPDAPIEDEHLDKFLPRKTDETFDAGTDAEKGFDSKWCYYKQVLAVGLGWMFLFMAVLTLRNLQSSMNHREGLGLITMGSFYGGMMIGSFMSSAIVQTLGPKITLSVSAVFHVTFVAANFYPSLPLLATVAAVAGVSHSSLWAAQSTYITALAKSFCKKFQASYENILARFFGLAFLFTELSTVLGNPLASFLLSLESTIESGNSSVANGLEVFVSQNSSYNDINSHRNHESSLLYQNSSLRQMHCGRHYCHSFNSDNSKMEITAWTRFVVVGVFTATAALALIIFIVTIKDRHIYSRKPGCSDLPRKLTGTLQSILDIKMVLCIPLITFFGFQMAFVSGDVVKAYITCSMGIQQVGNLMLFYGILDAFSAIAAGWLMKWVGSFVIFTSIVFLNVAVFMALLLWEPDGGIWGYVLFSGFGAIQGATNLFVNSQIGSIFKNSVESAYSVYRLFLGLGMSVGFAYSPYFCMETKIWTAVTLSSIAAVCYYALEVVHRRSLTITRREDAKTLEV